MSEGLLDPSENDRFYRGLVGENREGLQAGFQGDLPPVGSTLATLRKYLDEILAAGDDDPEPELFDRLSRAAAEAADLERLRRKRRLERATLIAGRVSELFPELAARAAAGFVLLRDEGLDRAAAAVESAAEAGEKLVEADGKLRAAIDSRDYAAARDEAGRADKHQAAIAVQRELLSSLLPPLPDRDGRPGSPDGPPRPEPPAGGDHKHALVLYPHDVAAETRQEPSSAAAGSGRAVAPGRRPASVPASNSAPAALLIKEPGREGAFVEALVGDNHAAAAVPAVEAASAPQASAVSPVSGNVEPSPDGRSDRNARTHSVGAKLVLALTRKRQEREQAAAGNPNNEIVPMYEPIDWSQEDDEQPAEEKQQTLEERLESVRARLERDMEREANRNLLGIWRRERAAGQEE